jgi:predicted MFS family arabinose efflux permease
VLVLSRGAAGAVASAVLPAALVYIGDTLPFKVRQRAVADVLLGVALGTALGTITGGFVAVWIGWRAALGLPAVLAVVLAVGLGGLPESRPPSGSNVIAKIASALARPWVRALLALAFVEGIGMHGISVYFAPALEANGQSPSVAGAVVAAYGVGVLVGVQIVKRFAASVPGAIHILVGGGLLAAGYALAALAQEVPEILLAGLLSGGAYASMHSAMQTWATEVYPEARGTATALFVTALFAGAGVAIAAVAGLAQAHLYSALFLIAVAFAVATAIVGSISRARFQASHQH